MVEKSLDEAVIVPTGEKRTRAVRMEEVPPSERLVLAIALTIVAIVLMTLLEVVHMVYLGVWRSEIFSAITSLVGLVVGAVVGAKA